MQDYLELFADWYPEFLGNHFYPVRVAKTFTIEEREVLTNQLNHKQKQLLEKHRKYRIRSLFLKNSYMQTTQWRFSELKVNPFYPEAFSDGTKLKCDCGRPLKYQFILQSNKKKKTIALGINHFADHLNIPIEVAREIQKGVNEIDIALDELLWLKKNQVVFPESVWQRYCYAIYRNNQLAKPIQLNKRLAQRLLDFREAQMPVYISDYEAMETEIRRVNQQAHGDTAKFLVNKELFEEFYKELLEDLNDEQLFMDKKFLTKNSQYLIISESNKTKIPFSFYEALLIKLQTLEKDDTLHLEFDFATFCQTVGRNIDENYLKLVKNQFLKYDFQQLFFLTIPKVMRNGLLKAIRIQKETIEKHYTEKVSQLTAVFFQTLALLLKSPDTRDEPTILTRYIESMFEQSSSQLNTEDLLKATDKYLKGIDFDFAFEKIEPQLKLRLQVVLERKNMIV
jgi:hypothetical protein